MSYDNFPAKKNYTSKNVIPQGTANLKQKNRRMKLIKGVINRPSALINKSGNIRDGQSYFVSKAKGGTWHTYDNGKRVFVKRKKNA